MKKIARELWIMSNQQPWVEALLRGLIHCKTRSFNVKLPPPGSIVFLHASKKLWPDIKYLLWVDDSILKAERGGVCGVALSKSVGPMWQVFPDEDDPYFELYRQFPDGEKEYWTDCIDDQVIVFEKVTRIDFIPCKGFIVPSRKLPFELEKAIEQNPNLIKF